MTLQFPYDCFQFVLFFLSVYFFSIFFFLSQLNCALLISSSHHGSFERTILPKRAPTQNNNDVPERIII